jgi:hypothetical protein
MAAQVRTSAALKGSLRRHLSSIYDGGTKRALYALTTMVLADEPA